MRKNPLIARLMVVVVWLAGIQLAAAQNIIRIGEWRSHLPYTRGLSVTQSPTKVFYGTDRAFFSVDKDSLDDIRFYSKIDGLSDVGVRQVKYQAANDVLIVIYNNSNIDLVFQGGIVNIDDIVQNNTIIGSKVINDVWVGDTDFIYLSCDFGLVEFNVMTGKFGFTMFTNTPVRAFTQYSGGFYIATDSGIYFFDNFSTELVSNFDAWERMGSDFGLPDDYQAQGVTVYQDELFAAADNVLYNFDQGDFMPWDMIDGREITFLSPEGQFLMVGFNCPNASCNGTVNFYDTEGQVAKEGFQCTGITQYAIGDEDGRIWYADRFEGIRYANDYTFGCERLDYDTPFSSNVSEIAIKENTVYVAAGGVTDRYNNLNRPDGFFTLKGRDWSFQNRTNNEQLAAEDPLDYFRIAPHPDPDSPLVYIGTYFSGLIRFNTADSIYTFYDQNNSALQGAVGDDLRERVAGMAFDREGNLWMSNYLAPRPIVVLEKDGTWRNFSVPGPTELGEVVIDQRG